MSNASQIASRYTLTFPTRVLFLAAKIPAFIKSVFVAGFAAAGDCPAMTWVRLGSAPSGAGLPHPGQKQTADGGWWQIVPDAGNVLDVRWFGCTCNTVTNDLAALTDARDAAVFLNYASLLIPNPGMMLGTVGAPMSSWAFSGIRIKGQDANRTVIFLPGAAGISFLMDGLGGVTGGGLFDMVLWAPAGKASGQALRLDGDATHQPDETAMHNLKITGSGAWDIPLYLSGADRALGSPPGLRKVSIINCFIGRGTSVGMYCDNVEELNTFGLGVYGGVVAAGNNIQITSTNGATRSSLPSLLATNCQGTLLLGRAQTVNAQGNFNAINAGVDTVRCTGMGFCTSVVNVGAGNDFSGFV